MKRSYVAKIKIRNVELGYSKLEDGTFIISRVAIVDVRPIQVRSPFGVEFEVSFTTGISAHPSKEALNLLKEKGVLMPGETPPNHWKQLEIREKKPAVEEVEFNDPELGKYIIRVEIEPLMASVNVEKKNIRGEPIYVVRWSPKVSWRRFKNDD